MDKSTQSKYLKTAIKAAKAAGEILKKHDLGKIKEKTHPGDLVTKVDMDSTETVIKILKESFPDHNIISEEIPFEEIPSGYTWVIDPLDGTLVYSLGFNYSSVSIGLMKDHIPIMGVVYHPMIDELFYAEKGKGAFKNGKQIHVSKICDLAHSTIVFGATKLKRINVIKQVLLKLADKVKFPLSLACATFGTTKIADGTLELYIYYGNKIWDLTAVHVILTEAGGKATDLEGKPLKFNKKIIDHVFSNGEIHDEVIEIIRGKQQ